MGKRVRHEWRLPLPAALPRERSKACVGLKLRSPRLAEAEAMGALLLDAYRGTADDEGEDLAGAVAAAEGFFAGKHARPMPEASVVAWRGDLAVGLCLVGWWALNDCPLIVTVAVRSDSKGAGVGRLLLGESVRRLSRDGRKEVGAVVTVGNRPSEALFSACSFKDFGDRSAG